MHGQEKNVNINNSPNAECAFFSAPNNEEIQWLVVSNICYFPFHIWDGILPIDELHHFSRWVGQPPTR
jgi:hypothetical protein